jgi:hypothetical protein
VTEGGLELPLVASPAQVAQLLESVSEMAAALDPDGLLLSPGRDDRRAHPVRVDQVLSRVRVVVQRGTSAGSSASRMGLDLPVDGGTVAREVVSPKMRAERIRMVRMTLATAPSGSPDSMNAPEGRPDVPAAARFGDCERNSRHCADW